MNNHSKLECLLVLLLSLVGTSAIQVKLIAGSIADIISPALGLAIKENLLATLPFSLVARSRDSVMVLEPMRFSKILKALRLIPMVYSTFLISESFTQSQCYHLGWRHEGFV
jgi:hypothetical protein